MTDAALPAIRASWLGRGLASVALVAGAASALGGSSEVAVAAGALGLAVLGLSPRAVVDRGIPSLDLLCRVAGRAGAAERIEGTVAVTLECIVAGGHAATALAMIRRNDGGFCDAYFWVDGQLSREELLWQPELG